jgi:hypothetical protein
MNKIELYPQNSFIIQPMALCTEFKKVMKGYYQPNRETTKRVISTVFALLLLVGFFAAISPTANAAKNEPSTDPLDALIGTWSGTYTAAQGLTEATLEVYKNDAGIVETFLKLYPVRSPIEEYGEVRGSITFDTSKNTYTIRWIEWLVRPQGYNFADFMNGVLDPIEGKFTGDVYSRLLPLKIGEFELYKIPNEPNNPLEAVIGVYKGTYTALQGLTGLTLDVYQNDAGIVEATFAFHPDPSNPNVEMGKYLCSVSFDEGKNTYSIKGVEWIERSPTYVFADLLNGVLNEDGKFTGDVYYQSGAYTGSFELYRETIDREAIALMGLNWNDGNGNGNGGGINQFAVNNINLKNGKNYVAPENFDAATAKTTLDKKDETAIYTVTERTVSNDGGVYAKIYSVKIALFEDGNWKVYAGQITVDKPDGNNKTQQTELLRLP